MRMKMKLWISSTIFPFWVRKAEWAKGILLKKWTTHGRFVKPQLTKIRWNGHPTWRSMVSDTTPSPLYKLSTIKGNVQNSNTFASPVCADTICVLCNDMVEVVGSKCRKRQHPVLHGIGGNVSRTDPQNTLARQEPVHTCLWALKERTEWHLHAAS